MREREREKVISGWVMVTRQASQVAAEAGGGGQRGTLEHCEEGLINIFMNFLAGFGVPVFLARQPPNANEISKLVRQFLSIFRKKNANFLAGQNHSVNFRYFFCGGQ